MNHKCNDYIIRDGEYVRDFDEMYKNILDPWGQSENDSTCIAVNLAFFLIRNVVGNVDKILDIGCANGYHFKRFKNIWPNAKYLGTDISPTIIDKAKSQHEKVDFIVDDIRFLNQNFLKHFDMIFSSKTLYYVAPEIDVAINNIKKYSCDNGWLLWIYNMTKDAFSKQWLTPIKLRNKLIDNGFSEYFFIELNRLQKEQFVVGLFRNC